MLSPPQTSSVADQINWAREKLKETGKRLGAAWRPRTIRATLALMVLTCLLPAWAGMGVLIFKVYSAERERIAQNLIMTARAIALSVDGLSEHAKTSLQVLAASPELQSGDFKSFYKRAGGLVGEWPGTNIVLTERSGQQILNTLKPFGADLPLHANLQLVQEVFKTGRPVTTQVHWGPVAKELGYAIVVPVFKEGAVKYVLTTGVFQQRLVDLLNKQALPNNWVVSIFDPTGVIATRSHDPEHFVSQAGASPLLEAITQDKSGFMETRTLEGLAVYAAFSRSELSDWTVAIGVPIAIFDEGLRRTLAWGCGGALGILAIGLCIAVYESTQIRRAVRALIPPALALGRGEPPVVPKIRIQELDEVAQAFESSMRNRIFERDEAERERKMAEDATELKDEFIATVSHELRTPLTSITASLGLLHGTASADLSKPVNRLIDIAFSNCQRLVRLVNDILDVEKLASGKVTFDLQPVNIERLLARAIDANRPIADSAGVSINFERTFVCEVYADPDRLMQVFSNLLSNAIKFSPTPGQVTVSLEERGEKLRVSVSDCGPGVPEEFRARIFQKFAQADRSDARQKTGTGLGLSIAKEIVERLGGQVGFGDAPNGGAQFYVELPILKLGAAENLGRVLVCEDDVDVGTAIAHRLRTNGFAIDQALTACDAVAKASLNHYVAILVDLQLPDGDGISLIQILRGMAHHATTPIIVVAANPGRGRDDLRAGNLNVFDWIGKPFNPTSLVEKIYRAIDPENSSAIRVLHIDSDPNVITVVAQALSKDAIVVPAATVESAIRSLKTSDFDLAIVDLDMDNGLVAEALPHLRDQKGNAIPVIVYSTDGANPIHAQRVKEALAKTRGPLDSLVELLRARILKGQAHGDNSGRAS
jgi:signal transduction histidine kinase/DNA-binding response OmpR family regulator